VQSLGAWLGSKESSWGESVKAEAFFRRLWGEYVKIAPRALAVHDHVARVFGRVENDHVAFRTFNRPGFSLDELFPAFIRLGYREGEEYAFSEKHLRACSLLPPSDELPLVFISELWLLTKVYG